MAENIVNTEQIDQLRVFDDTGDFLNEILIEGIQQIDENIPQLEELMRRYDLVAYQKKGHYLKGSALTMGLPWLAAACYDAQLLQERKLESDTSQPDVPGTKEVMHQQIDEIRRRRNVTVSYLITELHMDALTQLSS